MKLLMSLLDALYEEQKVAQADDQYSTAHAYDVAVDLADSFSKGISPSVWLPRYQVVMRELAEENAGDGDVAYLTAASFAEVLLEEYLEKH